MGKNKKKKKPAEGAQGAKPTLPQQPPSLTGDDFPQLGGLAQALPSPTQPPPRQAANEEMGRQSSGRSTESPEEISGMGRGKDGGRGRGQDRGRGRGQDRGRGRGQDQDDREQQQARMEREDRRSSESSEQEFFDMGISRGQDRGRGRGEDRGRGRGQDRGRGRGQQAAVTGSMAGYESPADQIPHFSQMQQSPIPTAGPWGAQKQPQQPPTPEDRGRGRGEDRGRGRGQDRGRGRGQEATGSMAGYQSPTGQIPQFSPTTGPSGAQKQPPQPLTPVPTSVPSHQEFPTPTAASQMPTKQPQKPPTSSQQPQRQTPPSQLQPVSSGAMVPVGRIKPPLRPDKGGTEGRRIRLVTNHIEVKFDSELIVYHYDVEFASFTKAPKKLKRRVFDSVIKSPKYKNVFKIPPVFDGQKNLYSPCLIPGIGDSKTAQEFKVDFTEEDSKSREFILKIKYAESYSARDLHDFVNKRSNGQIPREVIQVFDVVLRHQPLLKYIQAGRNIYIDERFLNQSHSLQELGGGLCAWFGAFTSLRPSEWKITLNVDMSTTAFVKSISVIEYMTEVLELRDCRDNFSLTDIQRKIFAKQLKGLKVQAMHQGTMKRKYPVLDIVRKTPSQHAFDCDGKEVTTEQYFASHYKYRLRYRNLQLLHVGQKAKQTMLPMEVCHIIPGQKYPHKINEKQTAAMIKYAACRPDVRFRNIEAIMRTLDFDHNKDLTNFGLNVSSNLVEVHGRVLNVPQLAVKQPVAPSRDGVWDMRGNNFYQAGSLESWGVLNFGFRFDPTTFIKELKIQASKMGMRADNPLFVENVGDRQHPEVHFKKLKSTYQKPPLKLVICVIPTRTNLCTYENIKQTADVIVGIPTQCIKERNAQGRDGRPAPALLSNLLLKINAKVGGINNILHNPTAKIPILGRPILLLGADVTHPAPSEKHRPSIAALVGSMNPTLSRYVSDVKVQGHRVEPITDLALMTRNMLIKFYNSNQRAKPERIIMYRDGVSEGQFDYVLVHELQAIQKACTSLEKDYKPAITFIVVQKRHHTRLIPQNPRDATKSGNVPPGTVVDQGITHPTEFDWFLCSHLGLQGTSKPAHYHVLYDDCGFKSDPLQNLTNHLCYMCFRCTRSISIPAPTYYAHLVAFRARSHLTGHESDHGSTVGTGGSGEEVHINLSNLQRAVTLNNAVSDTMYFN